MNYYNENDHGAAMWLRQLIVSGEIPPGYVDERSIDDVRPSELTYFTQCHFFAGIGGWSLALKLAGWPEDRPVWTGSCPCQPFSSAGKGGGFDDERHLWPSFYWLIQQCRPGTVFGEQVASKAGLGWLDLVQADMEASGYAFGAADICAAGIGAPHIRQRTWWVAQSESIGLQVSWEKSGYAPKPHGGVGRLVDTESRGQEARQLDSRDIVKIHRNWPISSDNLSTATELCGTGGLADSGSPAGKRHPGSVFREEEKSDSQRLEDRGLSDGYRHGGSNSRPAPLNGFWRDADWLYCRDGKWRPVKSGLKPLVDGLPRGVVRSLDQSISPDETAEARGMRLKGYGNAINPWVAAEFVKATGLIWT